MQDKNQTLQILLIFTCSKINTFTFYIIQLFQLRKQEKMGCVKSQIIKPQVLTRQQIQRQLDLQYSKKIFLFVIDTLYVIAHKFDPTNYKLYKQLHSGIDCSSKNLSQLKFQLKLNIILFQVSKRKIEIDQSRKYPQFQARFLQKIISYQSFFQKDDKETSVLCKELIDILNGKYAKQVKHIQTFSIEKNYQINGKLLVRQGIKATLMKDEIQNKFNLLPSTIV